MKKDKEKKKPPLSDGCNSVQAVQPKQVPVVFTKKPILGLTSAVIFVLFGWLALFVGPAQPSSQDY
jgi:hypothetical protein